MEKIFISFKNRKEKLYYFRTIILDEFVLNNDNLEIDKVGNRILKYKDVEKYNSIFHKILCKFKILKPYINKELKTIFEFISINNLDVDENHYYINNSDEKTNLKKIIRILEE